MLTRVSAVLSRTGQVFQYVSHLEVQDFALPLYLWCRVIGEGSERTQVDIIPWQWVVASDSRWYCQGEIIMHSLISIIQK